jgi:hypothetical protein
MISDIPPDGNGIYYLLQVVLRTLAAVPDTVNALRCGIAAGDVGFPLPPSRTHRRLANELARATPAEAIDTS